MIAASYTLGFLMTRSPGLVFRMKHKFSNKNCLVFSFMEKMFVIQFHSFEKMPIIIFLSMEKKPIMLFS